MEVSGRKVCGDGNATKGVYCDPCRLLNKNETIELYRVECDEFFCKNCSSNHKLFKITRNHKLLSQDEISRKKLTSTEETACSKHREQVLEYYCKIHKNFFCTLCLTFEHQNCSYEHIDAIAPDYENSLEYRSLTEKISGLLKQFKDIRMTFTKGSQDLHTMYTQFVSDVVAFRQEINNLLDSMETSILKQAEDVKEFDMKTVQTVLTACDTVTTAVNEIATNLETHKQNKQQRQFVISAKTAETKMCEYEKERSDICTQNKIRKYRFHKNERMLHSLQSFNKLGTLVDSEKNSGNTEMGVQEQENVKPDHENPKSVRASYAEHIYIKHSEDKSGCFITGSVMINPCKIALTDWNNYSVKLVNVDSKSILSYLKLPAQPCDVSCVDKSQIVITSENRLFFVNVGHSLSVNKDLQVNGACRGIDCRDNQLFVSFVSPESVVKLISLHGEILKTFSKDQYGKPLFKSPLFICLNNSKSGLILSDRKTNTVMILDLEGRVKKIYRDTNLKSPCGLTVDKYDNIYIAGRESHNIHQISTQCRPIQILLDQTHGMNYPRSVVYCKANNKLYISHVLESEKHNALAVYKLQEES